MCWEQLEYGLDNIKNLHYGLIHVGLPTLVDLSKEALPSIKDNVPINFELCKEGDVAFADASEDTNEVCKAVEFYKLCNQRVVCGLHTIHGRDNAGKTVIGFKGYAFSSSAFHNQVRRIAQGTKIYSINVKNFSECHIGIPSKSEQRKIAGFLSLLDDRIAAQMALIGEMGRLIKGLNDASASKKDKTITLGDIGVFIRGLTYSNNDVSDNGLCVLRSVNISNGAVINYTDDIVFVKKDIEPEQELRRGDIVICMANGSSNLVGKNSLYDGNYCGRITVGAFCGIFRSSNHIARWLLQNSYYKKAICQMKQGGNGAIANINGDDLLRLRFNVSPSYTLYKLLDSLGEKTEVYKSQLSACQKQKAYFLQKMFI